MSGNSTRLTLVIGMCGDPMLDLPFLQLASNLEGRCSCSCMLNLNANDDDDDDDDDDDFSVPVI